MPILNGKDVAASEIDPAKHRFVGMFRPPTNPLKEFESGKYDVIVCPRGHHNRYVGDIHHCYVNGCCDVPQYADI